VIKSYTTDGDVGSGPSFGINRPPPGFTDADELERLRDRERQIIELLGSTSSDRIIHDLRNVLNEARLLRFLADKCD
jgi:hypothetical protein